MCDTVGHIAESLGVHSVEILEYRLYENIRVELGNSVDIMRADNAKVSHTHLTVADNAHRGNSVPVARESVPRVLTEALVYLLDDRIYSRETELEEILVPLLKRLGHYGVVGVGAYLYYHIPRSLPRDEVIVDEYSHKFGDAECGVSVVVT